ncbi:NgoFVII family restriction endonuclease [Spirosoma areae]
MCPQDGIEVNNHNQFKKLQSPVYDVDFKCDYIQNRPPVHSKVYAWYQGSDPDAGFIGSANYTLNAFSTSMREVLSPVDPTECYNYYQQLLGETINCADEHVPQLLEIYKRKDIERVVIQTEQDVVESESGVAALPAIIDAENVNLPLIDRYGVVPDRSGLNWGQRPGREPNQAYISVPADIGRSGFFPERYLPFTIQTDDDKQLVLVRAQDSGKALHSTLNNSLLGEYFRNRLGLPNGAKVYVEDLLKYGRTDVSFYKVDDETYYMDFAVR